MSESLAFYQDSPHPCSYLEAREASNIYPDPNHPMTNGLYSHLIQYGFRRSGALAYRPHCLNCQACVPVRINTAQFKLNRSQRRCLQRNQHLTVSHHPAMTDYVQHGLSALYTFFDPNMSTHSLGTYAILQQINIAKTHGLPWVYLGYWISNCQKMKYKQNFSGIEGYINQKWQALNDEKL